MNGKVALISGVARGQGRAHALRLAAAGMDIVGFDICAQTDNVGYPLASEDDLRETVRLVEETGVRIVAEVADVRDGDAVAAVVAKGMSAFGRLDAVVANAGLNNTPAPTWEIDVRVFRETIDVNLLGVWQTAKYAIPAMLAASNGGSVVLTSSGLGLKGMQNLAPYVSSKHAVIGLMRTLALELAPHYIRVNAVCPGNIDTPILQNEQAYRLFLPDLESPTREDFAQACMAAKLMAMPMPWMSADEVSKAVAWLVSDEARYVTGVAMPVDAGYAIV
jgi:(+)-trans-carveol dehydrogenase